MSQHNHEHHQEDQNTNQGEAANVAQESVAEKEPDLDARGIELTALVLDLDSQISDLQKKRAVLQKERRSIEGKIITRNMTAAAKKA